MGGKRPRPACTDPCLLGGITPGSIAHPRLPFYDYEYYCKLQRYACTDSVNIQYRGISRT